MPLFRSQDIRLYIGGDAVHGLTDRNRTIRSVSPSGTFDTYPVGAIGLAAARNTRMQSRMVELSVGGWFERDVGLQPAMQRATVADLPVTWSQEGGGSGTRSLISRAGVWRSVPVQSSDTEPVTISAEGQLNDPADARCIFEGRVTGGGEQVSPGLSQVTRPIPIRLTEPRLLVVAGGFQFQFQVDAGRAEHLLAERDRIQFLTGSVVSQIPGSYSIQNIQTASGVAWSNVFAERIPRSSLAGFSLAQRNSPDGIAILDTFDGARYACVHLSEIVRQDSRSLRVTLQGRAPGASTWNTIGASQTVGTGVAGQDFGLWFDVPPSTSGVHEVRVQLEFLLPTNVPGGRSDYSAYVRADFAPRVVHH